MMIEESAVRQQLWRLLLNQIVMIQSMVVILELRYFEFADLPLRDDSNRSQGDSVHDDGSQNDSQFSDNHSVSV